MKEFLFGYNDKKQGKAMSISLMLLPLFFSVVILLNKRFFVKSVAILFVTLLSLLAFGEFFFYQGEILLHLEHYFHTLFIAIDSLLLLYFLLQGVLKKDNYVMLLSLLQLLLYGVLLSLNATLLSSDIVVDRVSTIMYLIINGVGGLIIIYSLKYIESEAVSGLKKRYFVALEFFFLSVMNFLVSTNNIEIFFMLFELSTLCSYLLIGYRGDAQAEKNSLVALWMNQIGGVAILIALILCVEEYNTIYFDILVQNIEPLYLLPILFLAIAAFVKGASTPFEGWLLGAMVAPTPVSALLHSATMVKIAPYLMLKLAPAMSESLALGVSLFGGFVFFAASFMALGKDYFKEILGLSTIALLALMMALSTIGTEEAIQATLLLMLFHALSKALLFLQAGILEKSFGVKYMSEIDGLIDKSPLVLFFIVVGFGSLTLPPFGAFVAKFMAIESIATLIEREPLYLILLLFVALGSVFLTLLYFKVLTKLFAQDVDRSPTQRVSISKFYSLPSWIVVGALFVGIGVSYAMGLLSSFEILTPLILILTLLLLSVSLLFKGAHRVKEYYCGEKESMRTNMYYFSISQKYQKAIYFISLAILLTLFLGVLL